MKNQHHLILLCTLVAAHVTYTMEPTSSSVVSLYSLCTNKIITGYGDTYTKQCKQALESIEKIDNSMDEDFANGFKRSFVRHHLGSLPCSTTPFVEQCPSILIKNNNTLYGIMDKDMCIWNSSAKTNNIITEEEKIIRLHRTRYNHAQIIRCAIANQNGSFLYTGADKGGIKIWDIKSGKCKYVKMLAGSFWYKTRAFSENSNGDLCSTDIDGKIKIWDITTTSCKQTLKNIHSNTIALTMLANTDTIYAGGQFKKFAYNGPIFIYDTRIAKCIACVNSHNYGIKHLTKSQKDTQFYSSSSDKTIRVWDVRNMNKSVHVLESCGKVKSAEENKDGTLLFSCGNDGVHAWDLTTDKPYIINTLTQEPVHCMAQDKDASQLFVGTKTGIKVLKSDCTFDEACKIINDW